MPIENSRTISLVFQLAPYHLNQRIHPLGFLSHLLGFEGKGSFLSWARSNGLALGVSVGTVEESDWWTLLSVEIELTVKGTQFVDDIIGTIVF